MPSVNRAVIAKEEKGGETTYQLCVEGNNFREVMATYGIDGTKTVSNNVVEVYNTLGIEAARYSLNLLLWLIRDSWAIFQGNYNDGNQNGDGKSRNECRLPAHDAVVCSDDSYW